MAAMRCRLTGGSAFLQWRTGAEFRLSTDRGTGCWPVQRAPPAHFGNPHLAGYLANIGTFSLCYQCHAVLVGRESVRWICSAGFQLCIVGFFDIHRGRHSYQLSARSLVPEVAAQLVANAHRRSTPRCDRPEQA